MKKIALIVFVLCAGIVNAQEIESQKIFFKQDKSKYEPFYRNNVDMMKQLQRTLIVNEVDSITVTGSASIEGINYHNVVLGKRRAESVKEEIAKFDNVIVNTRSIGEDWDEFIRLIELSDLADKEEILSIAKSKYFSNDEKERKIMGFKESWKRIEEDILPNQRVGVSLVIYYKQEVPRDTVYIETPWSYRLDTVSKPKIALKTNLLYNLATAINISLEVPMGKKWSLIGTVMAPWWNSAATNYTLEARKTFEALIGDLEIRHYISPRKDQILTGFYVGAHGGGGIYDIAYNYKGYMGDVYFAGLTAGFSHRIFGKNTRIEYGIGLGYANTQYNHYKDVRSVVSGSAGETWVPVYQYTKRKDYYGLTKAQVTLTWVINQKKVKLVKYKE